MHFALCFTAIFCSGSVVPRARCPRATTTLFFIVFSISAACFRTAYYLQWQPDRRCLSAACICEKITYRKCTIICVKNQSRRASVPGPSPGAYRQHKPGGDFRVVSAAQGREDSVCGKQQGQDDTDCPPYGPSGLL